MNTPERRKHLRVKVYYSISYACMNEKGHIVQENMGMALNISQSGILIESADGIFSKYITLISVDRNENIIEIKGRVAYCKKESEKYRIVISFEGTHEQKINFAKKIIKSYHYNKSEYRYGSASDRKTICDTSATYNRIN